MPEECNKPTNSPTSSNIGNTGVPKDYVRLMFNESKIFESAIQEIYAHIAIAICMNPDCVDELDLSELVLLHDKLYCFPDELLEMHPGITGEARALLGYRISELELQVGLNRHTTPSMEQIQRWKQQSRKSAKEVIEEAKEDSLYWMPTELPPAKKY